MWFKVEIEQQSTIIAAADSGSAWVSNVQDPGEETTRFGILGAGDGDRAGDHPVASPMKAP